MKPKKSLGQHWLKNKKALSQICAAADLTKQDTVLEIGPGLGTLTKLLVEQAGKVVAVELDEKLALDLPKKIKSQKLKVEQGDILHFNLAKLAPGYKVVANIPYYLTSNLLRVLGESVNPPQMVVLLVQKEVAQRVVASPGQMSVLAISVQLYYRASLGQIVEAKLFTPSPKVDSQILILNKHLEPLFDNLDTKSFFRVVNAGFSSRRKKLRGSLSGSLGISKKAADEILSQVGIDGNLRAQNLPLQDWYKIALAWHPTKLML
ncbi:ribosomal RNA small subunit methyltransferase A [Candidatus Saccharibacteria bacterium CG10_big_fil_rev_8_21_14_0_10_47_8]|nr:MAG: ribosomal RNA small subunit methyltransferase A [Candidatus Saccharibacteria bacterium CG10_big_fil_rev_8_21_14_0_10_47_8]